MLLNNNKELYELLKSLLFDSDSTFMVDESTEKMITTETSVLEKAETQNDNSIVTNAKKNVQVDQSDDPLGMDSSISEPINANANISAIWEGGYKLELDFDIPDANPDSSLWNIELDGIDGEIRGIHGLEIIEQSGDTLTVTPDSGYKNDDFGSDFGNGVIIFDGTAPSNLSIDNSDYNSDTTGSFVTGEKEQTEEQKAPIEPNSLSDELLPELGNGLIGANIGDSVNKQQTGQFNYGEALQKSLLYFDANESGRISESNKFDWRGDATNGIDAGELQQGIHDTYFDAGDHVVFGQPLGYSNFALGFGINQYRQAYQDSGQLDEALDVIKRMSDGIIAGHEMSGGKTKSFVAQIAYGGGGAKGSHQFWNPPEDEQSSREVSRIYEGQAGTEVAANYAAGLAQAAIAFKSIDSAYSDKLLNNAKALFSHAETYQGKYSDTLPQASPYYKSHSGFADELAAAAGSIYQASDEKQYLDKAQDIFNANGVGYTDFAPSADNASTLATLILAQESNDPKYQQLFEKWADLWVEGKGAVQHSPGGQAFRQPWGSAVLSSSAAFAIETYADTVKNVPGYSDFATNQIDYVLGDNPRDSSYMVGFGNNSPQSPHHRGSAGTQGNNDNSTPNDHILYGALVGGPTAADDYSYSDVRQDYVSNEVGVSYNAALSGSLVQQYDNFGGDALTDQQLDQLIGVSVDI